MKCNSGIRPVGLLFIAAMEKKNRARKISLLQYKFLIDLEMRNKAVKVVENREDI